MFSGDGLGLNTVWAARIYAGQYEQEKPISGEEHSLLFETFPETALIKVCTVLSIYMYVHVLH